MMRMPNAQFPPPNIAYKANDFSLRLYEDWQDKTLYTITGPVTDDIQHNIAIVTDREVGNISLRDYADWNIDTLETELKSCRLLKKEEIKLANGMPAYRAIFSWWPTDELRIYQEQIVLLAGSIGYKLTATFTKKTRKTLGPAVELMMLSFQPNVAPSGK
jgi:hypothetical protein